MAYQTPKTDWQASDAPGPGDFNRIEGNIKDNHDRLDQIDPDGDGKVSNAVNADYATNADMVDGEHASAFARITNGTYTGDGAETKRLISVPFTPKFVYVVGDGSTTDNGAGFGINGTGYGISKEPGITDAVGKTGESSFLTPEITTNGFYVRYSASSACSYGLNVNTVVYYYVAIG